MTTREGGNSPEPKEQLVLAPFETTPGAADAIPYRVWPDPEETPAGEAEPGLSGFGARTSIRLDQRAFEYVEDGRLRSRMRHGRSIDRGRLVSSILHGLANAGFDLAEAEPEEIALAVSRRFARSAE
ncbi:hypothetical protein [Longimicrobium sp.]|uniref:hypothetical protein n=1 Tax=Longimicrobium sp. TaxID=2029185 RepID=UPI002C7CA70E|nr:hypothetical protein [Longimicrobium sp.]HSU13504.1 hypothetical protein [Longimicrobium sp.]